MSDLQYDIIIDALFQANYDGMITHSERKENRELMRKLRNEQKQNIVKAERG